MDNKKITMKDISEKYKEINTEEEFNNFIRDISIIDEKLFFRGQADSTWKVKSSYLRDKKNTKKAIPHIFEERFNFLKERKFFKTRLEILSLMQHNGLKTPLLDFTSILLNGIWFAFSEERDSEPKYRPLYILNNIEPIKFDIDKFNEEGKIYKCPLNIERGISQKSYFVIDNIDWNEKVNITKIIILNDLQNYIIKFLTKKSITFSEIYPDLKGLMMEFEKTSYSHYWDKGNVLFELKKYDKSIELYDKAIELNPNNNNILLYISKANVLYNMGVEYPGKGSKKVIKWFNEAIELYNKAIELNPKDSYSHNMKANALYYLEKYDKSIESYNKAINLSPNWELYFYKGNALYKWGEKLRKTYNKEIQLNPNNTNLLTKLIKNNKETIKSYSKAMELNPNNEELQNIKTNLLNKLIQENEKLKNILNKSSPNKA